MKVILLWAMADALAFTTLSVVGFMVYKLAL